MPNTRKEQMERRDLQKLKSSFWSTDILETNSHKLY